MSNMHSPRYMCSQLVTLSWADGASVVNLEEIQRHGCVFESEPRLSEGDAVEIRCGTVFFAGKITKAEVHEFGCRVTVEFSPLTPWSIERFRPEHLFDPASLTEST